MTAPALRELARAIDYALDPIARSLDRGARAAVLRDAFKTLLVAPVLLVAGRDPRELWDRSDSALPDVFRVRDAIFAARQALAGGEAVDPAWPAMLDRIDALIEAHLATGTMTHRASRRLAHRLRSVRAELGAFADGPAP